MLSMKDIARLSGVSLKTVSRVINNTNEVKSETRQKVLDVIEQYGYKRNIIATSLKEKKTRTIIIFIDQHKGEYWGIWHTRVITALIESAKKYNYKTIISSSSSTEHLEDETDGFYFLTSGLADGAILMDNTADDSRIEFLDRFKIPYVVLGKSDNYSKSHWVDLYNYNAGYMGGKYLVEKGYKAVSFMLGDEEYIVNKERANGFKQAMADCKIDKFQISYGITSMKKAYDHVKRDIENSNNFRAYFISGDERALGIYRGLQEKGIKIPQEVAVLGIDNLPHSEFLFPSLSSINQPIKEFSIQILKMLISLIDGQADVIQEHVLLPYEIHEREST